MIIRVFCEKEIRNLYKDNQILIITDSRNLSYKKECNTIQNKLSKELNVPLYPICIDPNPIIAKILVRNYVSYDYWFIDMLLLEYFS